jgi:hypothetical protein
VLAEQHAERAEQTDQDDFEMKKKKPTVVSIDKALHACAKAYCERHGLKMGHFASEAIKRALEAKEAVK